MTHFLYIEAKGEGSKVHHIELLGGGLSLLASSRFATQIDGIDSIAPGDWATWVGDLLLLMSVGAVIIQLGHSLRAHRARVRPYVVAFVYEGLTALGKPAVYLALENQGESAALDVCVSVEPGTKWYFVKAPDYPFERANGVPVISPGIRVDYFLGPLNKTSPLVGVYSSEVIVSVSYRSSVVPRIRPDQYRLTLNNKFGRVQSFDLRSDQ